MIEPLRGEIWNVNLDPTKGREQRGIRPALIVSHNMFNRSAAELCSSRATHKYLSRHSTACKGRTTGRGCEEYQLCEDRGRAVGIEGTPFETIRQRFAGDDGRSCRPIAHHS